MISKINKFLRRLVVGIVAICALTAVLKKDKKEVVDDQDGFQTKEFDDIW